MRSTFVVLLAMMLLTGGTGAHRSAAATAIIYVDATAAGANNGSTWDDAYRSLRTALAGAQSPAEIWVAQGVYKPTSLVTNQSSTFTLKNGVALYGGFRGDEKERAKRNPVVNVTVLSGDIGTVIDTDNTFHVVSASGTGVTAVLDGFTIRGGNANGTLNNNKGGGIFTGTGSPTLANLVIEGNSASADEGIGGGVYNQSGSPTLTNVAFVGNLAKASGGGMYSLAGSPKLTNVAFRGNSAASNGSAIQTAGGPLTVDGAVFEHNTTTFTGGAIGNLGTLHISRALFHANRSRRGGAITAYQATTSIRDSTFSGNITFTYGGAITNEQSELSLTNVTFTGNSGASGSAVHNDTGTGLVRNSIFWGDTAGEILDDPATGGLTIVDSLVAGGCPANTTCTPADILASDPLLGLLANNGGFSWTHALGAGSPAVDAADDASCASTDQRGFPRPIDGDGDGQAHCDLGAFEYAPPAPSVAFAQAGSIVLESATPANINVTLSSSTVTPVSVRYRVLGGSASGRGKDYTLAGGTLTFPALSTSRSIGVSIVNDRLDERVETVIIQLIAPKGAILGPTIVHKLRIRDDDPAVACRGRAATIVGTAANDTLAGTKLADVIVGLGGNDAISGGGGDDVICGGAGNDRLAGGTGNDVLVGAAGNDRLLGQDGTDQLFGLGGGDRLSGGPGPLDACDGGAGTDALLPAGGCEVTAGVP